MKIFINYALNHAFHTAQSRDKIDAINFIVRGGMKSVKAVLFVEAMSQDIEDTWNGQKRYCLVRKSNLCSYDKAVLNGFRWYEVL